mgnify:CR=1 FL=1
MREQAYSAEVGMVFIRRFRSRDLFLRKKARQLSHPASVNTEKKENYSGIIELPSFVM